MGKFIKELKFFAEWLSVTILSVIVVAFLLDAIPKEYSKTVGEILLYMLYFLVGMTVAWFFHDASKSEREE